MQLQMLRTAETIWRFAALVDWPRGSYQFDQQFNTGEQTLAGARGLPSLQNSCHFVKAFLHETAVGPTGWSNGC
jgi:hypothetical protein